MKIAPEDHPYLPLLADMWLCRDSLLCDYHHRTVNPISIAELEKLAAKIETALAKAKEVQQ